VSGFVKGRSKGSAFGITTCRPVRCALVSRSAQSTLQFSCSPVADADMAASSKRTCELLASFAAALTLQETRQPLTPGSFGTERWKSYGLSPPTASGRAGDERARRSGCLRVAFTFTAIKDLSIRSPTLRERVVAAFDKKVLTQSRVPLIAASPCRHAAALSTNSLPEPLALRDGTRFAAQCSV
jgi:hypothetical protein